MLNTSGRQTLKATELLPLCVTGYERGNSTQYSYCMQYVLELFKTSNLKSCPWPRTLNSAQSMAVPVRNSNNVPTEQHKVLFSESEAMLLRTNLPAPTARVTIRSPFLLSHSTLQAGCPHTRGPQLYFPTSLATDRVIIVPRFL